MTEGALRNEIETAARSEVAKTITQPGTKRRRQRPQPKTGSTKRGGKPSYNVNGNGKGPKGAA